MEASTTPFFDRIVGQDPSMQTLFSIIKKVADADSTILISGESGTGKELIAQAIHNTGVRSQAPFVPVNCAAIPHELLESELFGHEKGAFTHAIRTRIGRFELAHSGTIFLDEIGEMPLSLQVKLLRAIQERRFERVGGTKTISVDVRIIAATNVDLMQAVRDGRFREDLFYRLNVIPIHVPALRERQSDIPLLIDYFFKKFCEKKSLDIQGLDTIARRCLLKYNWPGNVRELENIIERIIILASDPVVTVNDLPEHIGQFAQGLEQDEILNEVEEAGLRATSGAMPLGFSHAFHAPLLPEEGICLSKAVEEYEKALIIQALERTNWVKNRAAKLLQMNRTTLIEKLKKQNIAASEDTKDEGVESA